MKLNSPFIITPRLLPGVKVADAFISIEIVGETSSGRTRYQYHIDASFKYTGSDLKSGCQGGDLQGGMESLSSFLGAAADAYRYHMATGRESENFDLFPANVMEWAYQNSDELQMLALELEENKNLIED